MLYKRTFYTEFYSMYIRDKIICFKIYTTYSIIYTIFQRYRTVSKVSASMKDLFHILQEAHAFEWHY